MPAPLNRVIHAHDVTLTIHNPLEEFVELALVDAKAMESIFSQSRHHRAHHSHVANLSACLRYVVYLIHQSVGHVGTKPFVPCTNTA